MPILVLVAAWAVLLVGPMAATAAEDFAVHMDRPAGVGEQRRLSGRMLLIDSHSITGGESPQRSEDRRLVRWDVAVRTLEVGPKGYARRAVVTVQLLTREADGGTTTLIEPGATLDARVENGKKVFELKGKPIEGDEDTVLEILGIVRPDEQPSDDEVAGSRQRRRVGESWRLNPEALARAFGAGFPMDLKTIDGTVKLVARKEDRHVPCLEYLLTAELTVPREKLPPSLPASLDRGMAIVSMKSTTLLPLDVSLLELSEDTSVKMRLSLQGTLNGKAVSIEFRNLFEWHLEASPMPRAAKG